MESDQAVPPVQTSLCCANTMRKTKESKDRSLASLTFRTHLEQMEDMRARMNHLETLVGDLIETMNGRATRSTLHSHQTSSAHPT